MQFFFFFGWGEIKYFRTFFFISLHQIKDLSYIFYLVQNFEKIMQGSNLFFDPKIECLFVRREHLKWDGREYTI